MQIEPIPNAPFGVRVNGLRCASVSPEEIGQLQKALHEHQLLVIPRQNELTPAEEVMFYRLIYPQAKNVWRDQTENAWERFKVDQGNLAGTYQIPDEPGVLVLGKGQINHHGLQVTLGGDRTAYGKSKGSQVLGGGGLQWHIDGPFYEHAPGLYTQMRCLEAPQSEGRWIDLANGGDPVWCAAGATAFASGRIAFDLLSAMDQSQCLGTRVHYFPRPFETTYRLGIRPMDFAWRTLNPRHVLSGAPRALDKPLMIPWLRFIPWYGVALTPVRRHLCPSLGVLPFLKTLIKSRPSFWAPSNRAFACKSG